MTVASRSTQSTPVRLTIFVPILILLNFPMAHIS